MKTNWMKLSALLFAGMFIFAACSSEDDKTKTELLTAQSWKATHIYIENVDVIGDFDECDADDLTTYFEDGNYQVDEGATKCDPENPQIVEEGTWSFNADETELTTVSDGLTMVYTIITLNESTLEVSYTDPFFEIEMRGVFAAQ